MVYVHSSQALGLDLLWDETYSINLCTVWSLSPDINSTDFCGEVKILIGGYNMASWPERVNAYIQSNQIESCQVPFSTLYKDCHRPSSRM